MNRFFASFIFLCSALFGYELQIFGGSNFFKFSKVTGKYAFSNHVNTGFIYRTALADYENARAKISFTSDNAVLASIGDAYSALSQQEISFQKSLGAIDAAITVGLGAHYVAKNESDEENKWQHNLNSIFSCGIDLSYQQFSLDVFAYVPIYNLIALDNSPLEYQVFELDILSIQSKPINGNKNNVQLVGKNENYKKGRMGVAAARLYFEANDSFRIGVYGWTGIDEYFPTTGLDLLFKYNDSFSVNVTVETDVKFENYAFGVFTEINFDAAKAKYIKPSKSKLLIRPMIAKVIKPAVKSSTPVEKVIEYDNTNVFIISKQAEEYISKNGRLIIGKNFVYESDFLSQKEDLDRYMGSKDEDELHSIKVISIDASSEEKIVITDVFEKMSELISTEGAKLSKEENMRNFELCLKHTQVFNFFALKLVLDTDKQRYTDKCVISADLISNYAENPILRTLSYYLDFIEDKISPFVNIPKAYDRYIKVRRGMEIKLSSDFQLLQDKQNEFMVEAFEFFKNTDPKSDD